MSRDRYVATGQTKTVITFLEMVITFLEMIVTFLATIVVWPVAIQGKAWAATGRLPMSRNPPGEDWAAVRDETGTEGRNVQRLKTQSRVLSLCHGVGGRQESAPGSHGQPPDVSWPLVLCVRCGDVCGPVSSSSSPSARQ